MCGLTWTGNLEGGRSEMWGYVCFLACARDLHNALGPGWNKGGGCLGTELSIFEFLPERPEPRERVNAVPVR